MIGSNFETKYRFSIITVSLNAENVISKTINSIIEQTFSNYEIIVKDGKSKDRTLMKIPKNEQIHVIISSDTGIYDAMNQAVVEAKGEYICFLNAGDIFSSQTVLADIDKEIGDNSDYDIIYGNYIRNGVVVCQPSKLTRFSLFRNQLNHQSMFFSKRLFNEEKYLYDTSYLLLADYELLLRAYFTELCIKHSAVVVDIYEGNGISESPNGLKIYQEENKIIRKKYFPKEYFLYCILIMLSAPNIRRWLVRDSMPLWVRNTYRRITNFMNGSIRY